MKQILLCIFIFLFEVSSGQSKGSNFSYSHGAIYLGDTTLPRISLIFTGDEYADGGKIILSTLHKYHIKASFFLTGYFYSNRKFFSLINHLKKDGLSRRPFG